MTRVVFFALLLLAAGTRPAAAQFVDGKPIYEEHCRECHGVRGVPPKDMQVKYDKIVTFDGAFIKRRPIDSLVKVVTRGKDKNMKSFKDKLTGDQILAVAFYVRELANKAKP